MKKIYNYIQFIIGLLCALASAILFIQGNIFAENNTNIAIVIGIIGISLIATSPIRLLRLKKE
jgi:hypothetical protein